MGKTRAIVHPALTRGKANVVLPNHDRAGHPQPSARAGLAPSWTRAVHVEDRAGHVKGRAGHPQPSDRAGHVKGRAGHPQTSDRAGLAPSWTHAVHVEDRAGHVKGRAGHPQPAPTTGLTRGLTPSTSKTAPDTSKAALDTLSPQTAPDLRRPGLTPSTSKTAPDTSKAALDSLSPQSSPTTGLTRGLTPDSRRPRRRPRRPPSALRPRRPGLAPSTSKTAPSTSKTAPDTLSPQTAPDLRRPGLAPSTSKTALDSLSPQSSPTTGLTRGLTPDSRPRISAGHPQPDSRRPARPRRSGGWSLPEPTARRAERYQSGSLAAVQALTPCPRSKNGSMDAYGVRGFRLSPQIAPRTGLSSSRADSRRPRRRPRRTAPRSRAGHPGPDSRRPARPPPIWGLESAGTHREVRGTLSNRRVSSLSGTYPLAHAQKKGIIYNPSQRPTWG